MLVWCARTGLPLTLLECYLYIAVARNILQVYTNHGDIVMQWNLQITDALCADLLYVVERLSLKYIHISKCCLGSFTCHMQP